MYIALRCTGCGRDHPLRELTKEGLYALLLFATIQDMHEIASNQLSNREWVAIILAEIALRNRT